MNCLDFRRDVLAQPLRLGADADSHARDCASCRAFLERQRELDAQLFDALRVPVPDGLADRVLVSHGIRRRRAPWLWALAASVVAATTLAWLALPVFSGRAIAAEAIAHVHDEPQALRLVSRHDPALLATELGTQGVRLARAVGEVTYAQLCPTSAGYARHIVVATDAGPVTLLLMPADATRRGRAVVESGGMTAITLATARGSMAIVAPSREQAMAIERSLILA